MSKLQNSDSKTSNGEGRLHILHVDDEQGFLEVSKSILELKSNFEVDNASSVDEAFKKLEQQTYDAVISDYEMPQKNGLDFLKELREQKNTTPFVIFTGKGREEVAMVALNLGADGYYDKIGSPETVYGELAHGIRLSVEYKKAEEKIKNLAKFPSEDPSPVLRLSKDGAFLYANNAGELLLQNGGCKVGNIFRSVRKATYALKLLQDAAAEAFASQSNTSIEVEWNETVYLFSVVPILEAGYVNLYGKDITKRKQAEQRIVELNSLLVVVNEINQFLLRIKSESELFQLVCDSLTRVSWIKFAWVGLVEKENFEVKPIAHAGVEDEFSSALKVTWDDSEYGKGPPGTAIKTRQPLVIGDIAVDPRVSPYREEALKRGYKSHASLPLVYKAEEAAEEVVGVLSIFSDRENAFDDEKVGFLIQVANDVAMGIRTLRRQEERQKTQGKLIDLAYRLNGLSPYGCFLCESHERVFTAYADLTFHGVPGLCIVREDPEKLVKEYGVKPEEVKLLSSKPVKGFQNLQDLQEVSIAISKFHETHAKGVILIDGLEYLVSRFGFDVVYKFIQEKRFDFLENGALLLIPLHMATVSEKERALLTSEMKILDTGGGKKLTIRG